MLKNLYIYKKCSICGKMQKNIKRLFFCIKCNKIFCDNKLCSLIHKCNSRSIVISKLKNICLEHIKYYDNCKFTCYCKKDNKHLCDYCINEGSHIHGNDIPINIKFLCPLEINNIKEEQIFFDIILKLFNNKKLEISTN